VTFFEYNFNYQSSEPIVKCAHASVFIWKKPPKSLAQI